MLSKNIYSVVLEVESMVSKRLQNVPASGTVKIANLVSQMKADGVDIVSFSMGEPDLPHLTI